MNVLWWIRGHSRTFRTFVANRIGKIQLVTSPNQWRYVPPQLNPADYLTRGLKVSEVIDKESWWNGPKYLQDVDETTWPEKKVPIISQEAKGEVKKKYASEMTMMALESLKNELQRLDPKCFSSWRRYVKVFSWVMRFINNCRVNKDYRVLGELSLDEIQDVEKLVIKNVQ